MANPQGLLETITETINMNKLAIFDLDDTLIDTSHVYWLSRSKFVEALALQGFDRADVLATFEKNDTLHIAEYGFVPERYLKTMEVTYLEICRRDNVFANDSVMLLIRDAGGIVQQTVPSLLPGAVDLLRGVRDLGFKVHLLTRGVESVQRRKIEFHGMGKYFEGIDIVSKKDVSAFHVAMKKYNVLPHDCWVVGDSVKSDMNPAFSAGANCILYLYSHHSYYWQQEYGVKPVGEFFMVQDLPEVLEVFKNPLVKDKVSDVPSRDSSLPK